MTLAQTFVTLPKVLSTAIENATEQNRAMKSHLVGLAPAAINSDAVLGEVNDQVSLGNGLWGIVRLGQHAHCSVFHTSQTVPTGHHQPAPVDYMQYLLSILSVSFIIAVIFTSQIFYFKFPHKHLDYMST